jgi:hypothetical protein
MIDNGLRLQLDVLNLFNARTTQIEYYYLSPGSRSAASPTAAHLAELLAARLTLAARF